ncbi:MAG TPA: carbon storage regulator [Pirellulales bacterium]|jgi:carbon storage regulator|nr:carbon storage regulator [Pirellulales bacterium]
MLVLTRKVNERIRVGEDITITVVRLGPGSVRIGIDAPQHLNIVREELTHSDSAAAWAGTEMDLDS